MSVHILEAKESLRVLIHVWASERVNREFTLGEAMTAFNKSKSETFARMQELATRKMIERTGEVRNGFMVFRTLIKEQ